jgi:hypothetical protein
LNIDVTWSFDGWEAAIDDLKEILESIEGDRRAA